MLAGTIILILAAIAVVLAVKFYKSQRKQLQQAKLLQELRQEKKVVFDFLHDLGESLSEEMDRRRLLDTILECCTQITSSSCGIIYIRHQDTQSLVAESVHGRFPPPVPLNGDMEARIRARPEYLETVLRNESISLDQSDHIFTKICLTGNSVWIANAEDDGRWPKSPLENLRLHSLIAVPLKFQNEVLGVLALANPTRNLNFTLSEFEVLKSVATQASFALYHANIFAQLAEKQLIDKDIETAREVQRIMLPDAAPALVGYELTAINQPAQRLSGDYYDFLKIDEDHWGIVIADVSGKGIPASLIMAMCRTIMRTEAVGQLSAAEVLRKVNRVLCPDIRQDMFITMIYMILNTREHTLTLAKAGHDAPLIVSAGQEEVRLLQIPGMALGIDSGGEFDKILQDLVVPVQRGDMVLVYTDGVSEATDAQGQEFGRDPIKAAMKSLAPKGVQAVVKQIIGQVARFQEGNHQADDITVVAFQRHE